MNRLALLLVLTFVESFACILSERGIYFYSRQHLAFTDAQNLWLGLAIGLGYVTGALSSHRLSHRWSERTVWQGTLIAQMILQLLLMVMGGSLLFFVINFFLAMAIGMKWPVVESYISAGRSPVAVSRALGKFNITWSATVPLSIPAAGFLIDLHQPAIFYVGVLINAATLVATMRLQKHPVHLTADHPDRLPVDQQSRYQGMCSCARWNLISSYMLMFVIAPLAPTIATRLGYETALAGSVLISILEVMRMVAFGVLQFWTGWHGRPGLLLAGSLVLPVSFAMVVFGSSVPIVVLGQIGFGLSCGVIYYAAIYYAMVSHNASVNAGGWHEALIGGGFALGPAIGLAGVGLRGPLGGTTPGMLAAVTPLALAFFTAGIAPLWKMHRERESSS